jgi:hypothetical protein
VQLDLKLDPCRKDLSIQEYVEVFLKITRVNSLDLTIGGLANRCNGVNVALGALDSDDVHGHTLFLGIFTNLGVECRNLLLALCTSSVAAAS